MGASAGSSSSHESGVNPVTDDILFNHILTKYHKKYIMNLWNSTKNNKNQQRLIRFRTRLQNSFTVIDQGQYE
jgi:hypothetical protein